MWTVFESVGKLLAHGELGLGTLKLHSGQHSVVQSLGGGLLGVFFCTYAWTSGKRRFNKTLLKRTVLKQLFFPFNF